jgi:hypothetical protein
MAWRHNRYNKKSAKKLGWDPSWFEASDFDNRLTENIMEFQERCEISQDGLCGPSTYRRILSEREAIKDVALSPVADPKKYIVCDGDKVPIDWNLVVSLYDVNNYTLPRGCYRKHKPHKRNVKMIITHFDVCLSAASCKRVLEKKGISSHFVIDNDGTIYQMVDPQHEGWHAGKRAVNRASIGVDISNGVYTKYQKWYQRKGFGSRPVLKNIKIHSGKIKECLGFYPVQLEAYKVLVKTLCEYYDIPIEMPMGSSGKVLMGVEPTVTKGKFKGIANHFHVTRGKWDTANLDWNQMLDDLLK